MSFNYAGLFEVKKKNHIASDEGFTLVELLVVVSIIAFFASFVVAALISVRNKAKNSRIRAEVQQYRDALELYRVANNDSYPVLEDVNNWHCLGAGYPGGLCGYVDSPLPVTESPLLNSSLYPYMHSHKVTNNILTINGTAYLGMTYLCFDQTGNRCNNYAITWMMYGITSNCGNSGIAIPGEDNTFCFIGHPNIEP